MMKLVQALIKSDRFLVRADNKLHRFTNAIACGDFISQYKGQRLWYRRKGFPESHGHFAAIIS